MNLFPQGHAIACALNREFLHYTLTTLFWTTRDFTYTHYYLVAIFVPHSVKSHQITSLHSQPKAALYNRNITLCCSLA